jgi:ribosomal-protein-alanine N-acetyltransferase
VRSDERTAIAIRPMRAEDLDQVMAIDERSFTMPWRRKMFEAELTGNPFASLAVAVGPADEVLGYVCIWVVFDELHLMTLSVHPDWRRRGIGEDLVRWALEFARRRQVRLATLEVRAGNAAARALYEKFGFSATATRPAYYREPREDAVIMTLAPLGS